MEKEEIKKKTRKENKIDKNKYLKKSVSCIK
jgi:hypothetical protein